jgi:predicted RNA-binding protein
MCESAVYLIRDSERTLVMQEAAKLISTDDGIVCVSPMGERIEMADVEIAEANLMKHEIILRPRKA